MNKSINIQLKYLLLLIATILVLLYLQFSTPDKKDTKTIETKEKVTVKEKTDSAIIGAKNGVKITVKVDEKGAIVSTKKQEKRIEKQEPTTTTNQEPIANTQKPTEAYQFKDTIKLKNGIIYTDIISTGKQLLSQKYQLKTFDSIIERTTTITETKYKVENVWFLNYEPMLILLPTPQIAGHQISVDYTIKNKFRFGIGAGYLSQGQFYSTFKIGIRL